MRAAKFARDSWSERPPGEVLAAFDQRGQHVSGSQVNIGGPRSWEELDCPDEITLELEFPAYAGNPDDSWLPAVTYAMREAGLSVDCIAVDYAGIIGWAPDHLVLTKQAEDCWYAGVPRGRHLVLRRL